MTGTSNELVTVKFTFIRHGESTDNLRSVWAGWRDSKLSSHGRRQAEALAESFASTNLTAIQSSPLERAFLTSQALQSAQSRLVPLETLPLLREQNFGAGEGQSYASRKQPGFSFEEHIAQGKFIATYDRSARFPDGESLNDVAKRADKVVEDIILPYVRKAAKEGMNDMHVAFVSHGIFIAELLASLESRRGTKSQSTQFQKLKNTGWTLVDVKVNRNWNETGETATLPVVQVVEQNSCKHLDTLVRQKGGIGSAAYDPKQTDIRSFFQLQTSTV